MNKYKILMVESDDFLRKLLERKFKEADYDFVGLKQAEENFIEYVVEQKPSLISISMLFSNSLSGIDILELLKKDTRTSKIPVIFLTNFSDQKYIEKAKSLGAVDYLITATIKPDEIVEIYSKYLVG